MKKLGIPISHGHFTSLVLKTGLNWAKCLGMSEYIFHVLNADASLEISDTLNHEWKMKMEEIRDLYTKKALEKTYHAIEQAGGKRSLVKNSSIVYGKVIDSVLKEIKNQDLSFLILGPKTHNEWGELFLGSTTERVIKLAKIPILVAKNEGVIQPKNVFWAADLSKTTHETLQWIVKLREVFSIKLTICHVEKNDKYQQKLDEVETALKKISCPFETKVINGGHGNTGELIIEEVQKGDYDLVVFGAKRKHNILDLFLGSVEEYLIHNIEKSFLIINVSE